MIDDTDDHDNTVAGPQRNMLRCVHCGQRVLLNLPLSVATAAAIMRRFSDLHELCHEQQVFVVEGEEATAE